MSFKNRFLSLMTVPALVLASCMPKEPDPAITLAQGQKTEITVAGASSTETVSFNSSTSWTARSSESWLVLSPTSGGGGDFSISAVIEANSTLEDRSCTVEITSGTVSKEIRFTQSARSVLDVDGSSVLVSHEGGSFKLAVGHNVGITVKSSQSWVSQVTSKAYVTDTLLFQVSANETHSGRTAYLTIASEDCKLSRSVVVKQGARTCFSLKEVASSASESESSFTLDASDVRVSRKTGFFVHLEDTTGAILYLPSNVRESAYKTVEEGLSVSGLVSGNLKKVNGVPQITSLDINEASCTPGASLPETAISLAALLQDYDRYLSCRLNLKGITIDKGTKSGDSASRTGRISQDGSSIIVYAGYTQDPAELTAGLKGELVCFPSLSNSTKLLSVYLTADFVESPQPAEETAFTRLSDIGVYNISDAANPVAVYKASDYDQISAMTYSSSTLFNICSLSNSFAIMETFGSKRLSNGLRTTATVSKMGTNAAVSSIREGTFTVVVARKTDTQAWLRTADSTTGYIISLE